MIFLVHELIHLLIALVIGLIACRFYRNGSLIIYSIIISMGIDIDHLVDYFHYFGNNFYNPITSPDFFCLSGKLFIPLHSWEIVLIFSLIFLKFIKTRPIFFVLIFSISGHLLLDQISYSMNIFSYSLIYRIIHNFDINSVSSGCLLY